MPERGAAPEGPSVLLALFFWRSLDLEGGAGLVRGLVESFPGRRDRLAVLLPERRGVAGDGAESAVPTGVEVHAYSGRTRPGMLRAYLRELRRLARQVDRLVLLENNPASHLLLRPWIPRHPGRVVHFSSPCVEAGPLAAGANLQSVLHWATKSARMARWAARLGGFHELRYVVSTGFQRDQLVRLGAPEGRVVVIPFAAAGMVWASTAGERDGRHLVIGYLGHFSPVKGVPDLLRAVSVLLAEGLPVELRIAWSGKGSQAAKVRRLASELPAQATIRIEGRVDVAQFLSELDVVVLPMRSESFPHPPLVLVEALAAGVPVIASDAGGLPELLRHGAWGDTFPCGDWRALAGVLRPLCADRGLLARWRRRIAAEAPAAFDNRAVWRALLGGE